VNEVLLVLADFAPGTIAGAVRFDTKISFQAKHPKFLTRGCCKQW